MNIAEGVEFGRYILILYNRNDINIINKNTILLNLLYNISSKLLDLQNNCGFIHGDFHSSNIFYDESIDKIKFIDFGYSTILMPNTNIIINENNNLKNYVTLTVPTDANINMYGELNLFKYIHYRAIDLIHLIENLYSIDRNEFNNNNNYKEYYNTIKNLRNEFYGLKYDKLIKENPRNISFRTIHNFTRSKFLDELGNNVLEKLYPYNFIKIINEPDFLNKISKESNKKSTGLFPNNSLSNISYNKSNRLLFNTFGSNSPIRSTKRSLFNSPIRSTKRSLFNSPIRSTKRSLFNNNNNKS